MRETIKATRAYVSALYHDEIARRLEVLLREGANTQSDPELARNLTANGCPCNWQTISKVRRGHGWGNKWQRIEALKQAAHDMVARQPIEGM